MSNQYGTLLLTVVAASIITAICVLGGYKSVSCSNLCLSNLSVKPDYAVTARISYGHPLDSASIKVTINGLYKSAIETDPNSILQFQAPLKVGFNLIKVEYNGSQSTASFFYMGGMLYMLLIPLSAILFLLIKRLASDSTRESDITFHFDDKITWSLDTRDLKTAISSTAQDEKRAVSSLPELITDVSTQLAKISAGEGKNKIPKDPFYLSQKITILKLAHVFSGCVGPLPISEEAAAARKFYEMSILSGSPLNLKGNCPKTFLKANKIIFETGLPQAINPNKMAKQAIKLFLFDEDARDSISRTIRSYSQLGAALLLMRLENGFEIIGC